MVAVYDTYSDEDRKQISQLADYQIRDYAEAIEILEREL